MPAETRILGLFRSEAEVVTALQALKPSPWPVRDVHGPLPSHLIQEALDLPPSRVGRYTLVGGIVGFFAGFALAAWTAGRWDLIVGGKPVVALVPFFIVGFECTILFSVLGNVLGLLNEARLPAGPLAHPYDARLSGDHFGIVGACPPGDAEALAQLMRSCGAVDIRGGTEGRADP
jgi:molybdopterin-containing oxidoreductase family membrane subunit